MFKTIWQMIFGPSDKARRVRGLVRGGRPTGCAESSCDAADYSTMWVAGAMTINDARQLHDPPDDPPSPEAAPRDDAPPSPHDTGHAGIDFGAAESWSGGDGGGFDGGGCDGGGCDGGGGCD